MVNVRFTALTNRTHDIRSEASNTHLFVYQNFVMGEHQKKALNFWRNLQFPSTAPTLYGHAVCIQIKTIICLHSEHTIVCASPVRAAQPSASVNASNTVDDLPRQQIFPSFW
ncbi:hypothetical protein ACOSQ3_008378 [Xanthoceras sorbifolium]